MLLTVGELQESVRRDLPRLVSRLQDLTGRGGMEEAEAWQSSLPRLADALTGKSLAPLHLYFGGAGTLALEYQLPAASSWADVVLLGRRAETPAAVVLELKYWMTRDDLPGPHEGLMDRAGQVVLHPSDQVRGYVEYCRRFHSAVQEHASEVSGCVLFTRDASARSYALPPNDRLVESYPCFAASPEADREMFPAYLAAHIDAPDSEFAHAFVNGRYKQDRGFVRQIGAQIEDPGSSPFVLLDHQRRAFAMVRQRLESGALRKSATRKQVILVEGPPGSGKSVLAARIWSGLVTDDALPAGSVVLTTTSTSQTSNWSKLFQIAGRDSAASGVIKRAASYVPVTTTELGRLRKKHGEEFALEASAWRENVEQLREMGVDFHDGARDGQHLVSVVDEAHALINPEHTAGRGQFGFAPTFGPLAWHIIRASTVTVFLLDEQQGFRDRENTTVEDIKRWARELGADVAEPISLAGTQFRCSGSAEYVEWVERLLGGVAATRLAHLASTWRSKFDLRVLETPAELEQAVRTSAGENRTARLLASYARKWTTKGATDPHKIRDAEKDFHLPFIEAGRKRHWSRVWNYIPQSGSDYTWFIQAPHGSPMHEDQLCEVGCPYAVRGFDFDYIGVLWLQDLVIRNGRWVVNLEHVHDTGLQHSLGKARKEGRGGSARERLRTSLAQAYRVLLTRGMLGCYLWFDDAETRAHVLCSLGE
jgi:hypothetical protein